MSPAIVDTRLECFRTTPCNQRTMPFQSAAERLSDASDFTFPALLDALLHYSKTKSAAQGRTRKLASGAASDPL